MVVTHPRFLSLIIPVQLKHISHLQRASVFVLIRALITNEYFTTIYKSLEAKTKEQFIELAERVSLDYEIDFSKDIAQIRDNDTYSIDAFSNLRNIRFHERRELNRYMSNILFGDSLEKQTLAPLTASKFWSFIILSFNFDHNGHLYVLNKRYWDSKNACLYDSSPKKRVAMYEQCSKNLNCFIDHVIKNG